jgi:putative membrane-bound dehydrogenase-like protein
MLELLALLTRHGLPAVLAVGFLAVAVPAWAQKLADGISGFEIDLVYSAPEIEHPSALTCDTEGNLFVGEDPMDMRGPTSKEWDRVLRISWDPITGAPSKTVFCQNLSSVFGLLWADGALYVMHAPHYSVFRDTDGDGVADQRQVLAEGFGPPAGKYGLNDHIVTGIRLGLDNRVYVSVGDKGIQRAVGSDGSAITLEGGGIVSMRLDGSQLEVVTSGTRNHLDIAMDSLDNMFTFDNTDDGLGWWTRFTHQVPTGYYGYPYDFLKHPERHLPPISEHGAGSPCGAACYRGAAWPEKYRDNVFYCEWGKGKVQTFVPKRSGATFTAPVEDFLVRDGGQDFRPIDLCFTSDGRSMYVADWIFEGSLRAHVCGRLFRVRYVGTDVPPEPARVGDDAPLADQLKALGHPADSERARAQTWLTRLGEKVIGPVTALLASTEVSKLAKVHALWTLSGIMDRNSTYDAAGAWIVALDDPDADIRSQAARALGEHRASAATARLVAALDDPDAMVRMWAVIALGQIGDPAAVPGLSALLKDPDSTVRFVAVQALRKLNRWQLARQCLAADDANARQAMLLALTGVYDVAAVDALAWAATEGPDQVLRTRAIQSLSEVHRRADPYIDGWWGIKPAQGKPARVKKHEWAGTALVMATLADALSAQDPAVRATAIEALVEIRDAASAPKLARLAEDSSAPLALRIAAARGLAKLGKSNASEALVGILAEADPDSELLLTALQSVGTLKLTSAAPAVTRLLASDDAEIRAQAIQTLGEIQLVEAATEIERGFADPDREVRRAALRVAGQLALREALDRILAMVSDAQVRDEAILALAAMPDRRALPVYLDGLIHKSPSVRIASRKAMMELRHSVGPDVIDRYQRGELPGTLRSELQPIFDAPQPITTWHVVGPWSKSDPPKFDAAAANLSEPFVAAGEPVAWRTITTDRPGGQVILNGELQPSDDVCALAYATIECAEEYTTVVQLGCEDEAILWVNGTRLVALLGNRVWNPAEYQAQITLTKGINYVWVLSSNVKDGWKFSVAFGTRRPEFHFLYEDLPQALDAKVYRDFALNNSGDAQRGREIFADVKGVGCIKCHAVGGQGAKIGPDLASIGNRYPRAELIRSVLEPSNRVADGYQVTTIVTDAGKVYSGIVKSDAQDVLELIDVEGHLISIPADEIDQRQPSNLSLMPSGLKDGLTPESFADVIAYLQSLK